MPIFSLIGVIESFHKRLYLQPIFFNVRHKHLLHTSLKIQNTSPFSSEKLLFQENWLWSRCSFILALATFWTNHTVWVRQEETPNVDHALEHCCDADLEHRWAIYCIGLGVAAPTAEHNVLSLMSHRPQNNLPSVLRWLFINGWPKMEF